MTGRTDLAQVPNRFHGPAERAAELVSQTGNVRTALLLDRRSFVVGEKVVVEAMVCNQTGVPLHCTAVLQQVSYTISCNVFAVFFLNFNLSSSFFLTNRRV